MNLLKSGILLSAILLVVAFSPAQSQTVSTKSETVDTAKIAAEAFKLITQPDPTFKPFQAPPMDSTQMADMGFEQVYKSEPSPFVMRDGKKLFAQTFSGSANTTIILLHGILSGSYTMNKCAGLIREATGASVIVLDLRGHGQSDGTPGDVDYIGQYADDVVDVIEAIKKDNPNGKIIIAGHSMGGGIALQYAMKKDAPKVNGYLLFSPLLGDNSPTLPKPSTTTDTTSAPFMKIHIERIIGLYLYNSIGVHQYDRLPVLFFNLPKEMPLHQYTYRSNKSMSPADYAAGLKSVKAPLLVLVGSKDEAFVANEFKPAVENNSKGKVVVIEGASHNGIRFSKEAMNNVKTWFQSNYNPK